MNCFRSIFLLSILALPARAETVIKFATLAPDGSTWAKVMSDLDKELQSKTGGQVRFKFYWGGVQGDEKDVVRKMRLGQLQSAGITGMGLGEVAPELRVLDVPFLFRSPSEVDYVLKTFDKDFRAALDSKGFALLGWTEVGFVHLFTKTPVRSVADLKNVKMWVAEGDPVAETLFQEAAIHPIPLSITDVMTSMETGLINGVYCSPMAALALQWHAKMKYVSEIPITYASGAVIVSKKVVGGLTPEQRKSLFDVGASQMRRLTALGREENRQAIETLKKEGLTLQPPASPDSVREMEQIGARARKDMAGRLYSPELLARIEKALADFRAKNHAKKP